MTNEKLIQSLKEMRESFINVYDLWESLNSDEADKILSENYPFSDELGEQTVKVVKWIDNAIDKL